MGALFSDAIYLFISIKIAIKASELDHHKDESNREERERKRIIIIILKTNPLEYYVCVYVLCYAVACVLVHAKAYTYDEANYCYTELI